MATRWAGQSAANMLRRLIEPKPTWVDGAGGWAVVSEQ